MTHESDAYGLWLLVVANSAVFIMFAFSFGKPQSPRDWRSFGAFSVALSVGHTGNSEYVNAMVRQSWVYADAMPTLPGTGLSPLAQRVMVPAVVLTWACRRTALE